MDEDARVAALAAELAAKAAMVVTFRPASVFTLAAIVQLACRHPHLPPGSRATADTFLAGVRAYFADCPHVLATLREGDDPACDVS